MISTPAIRLKYPIVLVHGLGARNSYGPFDYFYGIPRWLREAGNSVLIPQLSAWHRIEYRAEQLRKQIEAAIPEGKVNLVGHSMGGIDARYLASRLGFAERVASVTTIGTPNRGTLMADQAVKWAAQIGTPWTSILGELATQATRKAALGILEFFESDLGAFEQLGTLYCQQTLPQLAPDAPGVAYFSATSAIANPVVRSALPIFWLPFRMIHAVEGDNDGFVSVESARWGEHICTYSGDHYAQIGQFLGRSRGLNHFKFFEEILRRLKRDGF